MKGNTNICGIVKKNRTEKSRYVSDVPIYVNFILSIYVSTIFELNFDF